LRALIFSLLCLAWLPAAVAWPFAGVLMYYWLSIMTPQVLVWGNFGIPWAALFAVATMLGMFLSTEKIKLNLSWPLFFMVLFLAWTGLTTLSAMFPIRANKDLFDFFKIVLMAVVASSLIDSRHRIHCLVWIIIISAGFWISFNGFRLAISGGAATWAGGSGTPFSNSNAMARLIIMAVPLMAYLVLHSQMRLVRWGMLLFAVLAPLAMVATGSRGGFIGVAAMLAYAWLLSARKVRMAVLGVAALGATFVLLPSERFELWTDQVSVITEYEEVNTAQQRLATWRYAVDLANSRPITGGGFGAFMGNNYVEGRAWLEGHSNYFQALGEHGYVGLLIYLLLCVATFQLARRTERTCHGRDDLLWARDLSVLLRIGLVGYFVGGLTINHTYLELFYVYVVLVMVTHSVATRQSLRNIGEEPVASAGQMRAVQSPRWRLQAARPPGRLKP
jgi:putative inorganic carbon (hco3(-)) transporter